jgi:hypothetical protein
MEVASSTWMIKYADHPSSRVLIEFVINSPALFMALMLDTIEQQSN